MPMNNQLKKLGCTRNLLILVGLLCESIWLFIAIVTPDPQTADFGTETVVGLREGLPQSPIRDEAICIINSQTDTIKGNFRAKKKFGSLVGAIGFMLFVIAWKAHNESRQYGAAQLSPAAETTKDSEPTQS
jgi:hypothetical protein